MLINKITTCLTQKKHDGRKEKSISAAIFISTLRISARTSTSTCHRPLKIDFWDCCWNKQVFAVQTHTAHRGLCLRGCLLVQPCASKKLHFACSRRPACSAHHQGAQSSGPQEAALQQAPGGGTRTPQCLLCPLLPASLRDHWQNQRKIVALLLSNPQSKEGERRVKKET